MLRRYDDIDFLEAVFEIKKSKVGQKSEFLGLWWVCVWRLVLKQPQLVRSNWLVSGARWGCSNRCVQRNVAWCGVMRLILEIILGKSRDIEFEDAFHFLSCCKYPSSFQPRFHMFYLLEKYFIFVSLVSIYQVSQKDYKIKKFGRMVHQAKIPFLLMLDPP